MPSARVKIKISSWEYFLQALSMTSMADRKRKASPKQRNGKYVQKMTILNYCHIHLDP
jgi:hypothetical protein